MKEIKLTFQFIVEPLAVMINGALKEGLFPKDLKVGIVRSIFKKCDAEDLANYRPICILSSFSKIFEKVIANRLINFFNKFGVISPHQHGYISGKNTKIAIFELLQSVIEILERGNIPLGLLIDLSKAFDSVDHELLLNIL